MRCLMPTLTLLMCGCSTAPVADFLDIVHPAPKVAPLAAPVVPVLPTFPTAPAAPPVTGPPLNAPPAATQPPPPIWPGQ
jgi:hypothetical protein